MGFDEPEFNTQKVGVNTSQWESSSPLVSDFSTQTVTRSSGHSGGSGGLRLNISSEGDDFLRIDDADAAPPRPPPVPYADEEGVLLQADFEFDEDGNIVELAARRGDENPNPNPWDGGGFEFDMQDVANGVDVDANANVDVDANVNGEIGMEIDEQLQHLPPVRRYPFDYGILLTVGLIGN